MKIIRLFSAGIVLLLFAACATTGGGGSAAKNTSRAQFLDSVEVTPAGAAKAAQGAPRDLYREVLFTSVNISHLQKMDWWASQSLKTKAQLSQDADRLANYMKNAFERAVVEHPENRFFLVQLPTTNTLIIDLALVELRPAKAFWNATATAAGFVIPGASFASALGKGAIAIEGRVSDGYTGEILATFQHRDTDKFAVLDAAQFTWYHGSEQNIDDLAKRTAEWLNAPAGSVIQKSKPFTLTAF